MSADTRSVASLLDELRFNGRAHFTQNFRHALADLIAEAITADYDRIRALHDAEIVRLRGEVEFHQLDSGALRVQLDSCIERLEVQTKNALHLHAMMVDAEARAATLAPAEAKGDGWEENVRYLLDSYPGSIRVCPGAGHEELIGSLSVTFIKLRDLAMKAPQPEDGGAVAEVVGFELGLPSLDWASLVNPLTIGTKLYAHPPVAQVQGEAVDTLALRMLVAAGHVSQKLMDQSRSIARGVLPGPLDEATHPAGDALGAVEIDEAMIERGCKAIAPPVMLGEQTYRSVTIAVLEAALQHRGDSQEVGRG